MVQVDDLKGKVVLITGGGGYIGSAMARQFAANGARVMLADRNAASMDRVVAQITASGGECAAVVTDVSDRQSTQNMVETTVARYGRLDCLVNNAGTNGLASERCPIHEYDDELWQRIVNVNLNGLYFCSKPAIRQMEKQGQGGSIINIGSIAGLTPLRYQCAYTATKAAVYNLTSVMALELAPLRIRVNTIAPGSILTEGTRAIFYGDAALSEAIMSHIPLGYPGEPEDIAAMTVFLASEESRYTTGMNVAVDGGWTCGCTRDLLQ